jgi:hypothetical protein
MATPQTGLFQKKDSTRATVRIDSERSKTGADLMAEKVGAPRYQINELTVIYDTGDSFWTAPVLDASETGLFAETAHELTPGTDVSVMFSASDSTEAATPLPLGLKAKIVRVNEYDLEEHWDRTPGLAFHWQDIGQEATMLVRSFLDQHGVLIRS